MKLRKSVTEVTVMDTAASLKARPIRSGTVVWDEDLTIIDHYLVN